MYDGYTINLVLEPIFYVIENVLEINASIGKDSRPEFEKIRMCTESSKFCAFPKSALTKELNYASTENPNMILWNEDPCYFYLDMPSWYIWFCSPNKILYLMVLLKITIFFVKA